MGYAVAEGLIGGVTVPKREMGTLRSVPAGGCSSKPTTHISNEFHALLSCNGRQAPRTGKALLLWHLPCVRQFWKA